MTPDALLFDLDGLLIDSEPLWRRAELEVLRPLGVPLTEERCAETMGLRVDEVIRYWSERYPDAALPVDEVVEAVLRRVEGLIAAEGVPMPGAVDCVLSLRGWGPPLALVTSSPRRLIGPALQRLGLREAFVLQVSAEGLDRGKPHPEVYLQAAEALNAQPERCLVFEDSFNGVLAAKAAQMPCVAVSQADDPRLVIADQLRPSLVGVDRAWVEAWGPA